MARMVRWTCDGCDRQQEVAANAPDGWAIVTLKITGFRRYDNFEESYDLCHACQQTLINKASPKRWPRANESEPNGYK